MQRSFAEIAEASSLKRIVGFGSEACFLCFKDSVPTLFALALLDGVGMVGELDSMPDGSLSLGHLGLFHVSLLSLGALIPFLSAAFRLIFSCTTAAMRLGLLGNFAASFALARFQFSFAPGEPTPRPASLPLSPVDLLPELSSEWQAASVSLLPLAEHARG